MYERRNAVLNALKRGAMSKHFLAIVTGIPYPELERGLHEMLVEKSIERVESETFGEEPKYRRN